MSDLQPTTQPQPESFSIYIPFGKTEKNDDGSLSVWGRATQEIQDGQGETMDYGTSLPYWKRRMEEMQKLTDGNSLMPIREMHNPYAAGKAIQIDPIDGEKAVDICSKIYDPVTIKKIQEHVLNGYSVGGKYVRRWRDGDGIRYTADPHEISVVDVPAVPTAKFTLFKSADAPDAQTPALEKSQEDSSIAEQTQAIQELTTFLKAEQNDQETKLKALGERVGISRREGSPLTAPKDYPDDPSEYGDPANYNFPVDQPRHVQAVGRFNGGTGKEQYSLRERHAVGRRIARLASRFGTHHTYDRTNQKIVTEQEKTMNKTELTALLDSMKSLRDGVEDKEAFDGILAKMSALDIPKDPSTPITIENTPVKTPGATIMKAEDKPAPATASSTTDSEPTSTATTPPAPKKEPDDAMKALDAKLNKMAEANTKMAEAIVKLADLTMSKADAADPINDLNSIITSEMTKRMPLAGDEVIKSLETTDPYAFQKALRAARGKDTENDPFASREAMNDVNTKLRKATIDELTARGFTALNMAANVMPLPQ